MSLVRWREVVTATVDSVEQAEEFIERVCAAKLERGLAPIFVHAQGFTTGKLKRMWEENGVQVVDETIMTKILVVMEFEVIENGR